MLIKPVVSLVILALLLRIAYKNYGLLVFLSRIKENAYKNFGFLCFLSLLLRNAYKHFGFIGISFTYQRKCL